MTSVFPSQRPAVSPQSVWMRSDPVTSCFLVFLSSTANKFTTAFCIMWDDTLWANVSGVVEKAFQKHIFLISDILLLLQWFCLKKKKCLKVLKLFLPAVGERPPQLLVNIQTLTDLCSGLGPVRETGVLRTPCAVKLTLRAAVAPAVASRFCCLPGESNIVCQTASVLAFLTATPALWLLVVAVVAA